MSGNPKARQGSGAAPPEAAPQAANSMWGGRFDAAPDDLMTAINASVGFDCRLYAEDIAASKAHADMLVAQGIIPAADGASASTFTRMHRPRTAPRFKPGSTASARRSSTAGLNSKANWKTST